jgi:hypothetical protein
VNRIERRYDIDPRDGTPPQRIETVEDIRPFTPDALLDLVRVAGFGAAQSTWDYGSATQPSTAQFFTVVARAPTASSL